MLLDIEAVAIALTIAAVFFALVEVGFKFTTRIGDRAGDDAPFGVIQAAAFALVALLLGFSFSLAVQRFDARRAEVVTEANTIAATALRAQLLDVSGQKSIVRKLREYVDVRVAFSAIGTSDKARSAVLTEESDRLRSQMWNLAIVAAKKDPHSTTVPLFVSALNAMIDEEASAQATLHASVPPAVFVVLCGVVLLSAPLLGVGFGRARQRNLPAAAIFSLMLAIVVSIILDLDRPQRGVIAIDLTPLLRVQRSLHSLVVPAATTGLRGALRSARVGLYGD